MNAQEARADGWQHDTAQRNATIAKLAAENRELLSEIRYLDAENSELRTQLQALTERQNA